MITITKEIAELLKDCKNWYEIREFIKSEDDFDACVIATTHQREKEMQILKKLDMVVTSETHFLMIDYFTNKISTDVFIERLSEYQAKQKDVNYLKEKYNRLMEISTAAQGCEWMYKYRVEKLEAEKKTIEQSQQSKSTAK